MHFETNLLAIELLLDEFDALFPRRIVIPDVE